jgi:CheY-like chemotaxis protein
MQGKISIDSAPGSGTTFSLELPLKVVEAIANKVEQIPLSRIAPDMGREHPLRILVADDSDANKFIITALLEKLGYCIDTVSDGSEAFEAVRCGEYDVILMDIQMPKMNGVEATLRIRESAIKQPVIIALTANAFEEDKALAMEAGMDDFLTKPINLEALAKTLSLIAT